MNANAATLINLLGFLTGASFYGMLLFMVVGGSRSIYAVRGDSGNPATTPDRLPLATALLGLYWNIDRFVSIGLPSLLDPSANHTLLALLDATAFTALGYLPAVVVHSVLRTVAGLRQRKSAFWITIVAYALSTIASLIHFYSAIVFGVAPSHVALHLLTFGFVGLIVVLLISTRRQKGWQRAGWVVALAGFAVSAAHLSHHDGTNYNWGLELVGHHASLLLVIAILYQDFRFALADIFLKRALSLLLLVGVAAGLYLNVVTPFLGRYSASGEIGPRAVGLLLALWVGTALLYPSLRRGVYWFVDTIILHRVDYEQLKTQVIQLCANEEDPESLLETISAKLAPALTAKEVFWLNADEPGDPASPVKRGEHLFSLTTKIDSLGQVALTRATNVTTVPGLDQTNGSRTGWRRSTSGTTAVLVPTAEAPQYFLIISELAGGRRILSDDIAMLESVSMLVARRIDVLRVTHERCVQALREQEIDTLATEAELRALQAQLNPHFFFNALTTIGYLIQAAPDRALDTLILLTGLLRSVLRRSDGEFTTLGEEIDLIEAYLQIEQARFEERLNTQINVSADLRELRVPSLLLQPMVENAIKHGIAPRSAGGEVIVSARIISSDHSENGPPASEVTCALHLIVIDTGVGASDSEILRGRQRGIGITNLERRLQCHYGADASLNITSAPGVGTTVEIIIPVSHSFEPTGKGPKLNRSITTNDDRTVVGSRLQ